MQENKENTEDNLNPKVCDIALKPTNIPPGASPFGFWDCDTKTGTWYFNDPHIA